MKYAFIDCGAWTGISSKFFWEHHPKGKKFEYHLFECHPGMYARLTKNFSLGSSSVYLRDEAVWTGDIYQPFYVGDKKNCRGNSFYKNKTTGNLDINNPHQVHCINFSKFITDKKNFDFVDYIVCKMNIEGAEYNVIPHLIETGAINYINKLYISWHWNKIGMPIEKHAEISDKLDQTGVDVRSWNLDEDKSGNVNLVSNIKYFQSTIQGEKW